MNMYEYVIGLHLNFETNIVNRLHIHSLNLLLMIYYVFHFGASWNRQSPDFSWAHLDCSQSPPEKRIKKTVPLSVGL